MQQLTLTPMSEGAQVRERIREEKQAYSFSRTSCSHKYCCNTSLRPALQVSVQLPHGHIFADDFHLRTAARTYSFSIGNGAGDNFCFDVSDHLVTLGLRIFSNISLNSFLYRFFGLFITFQFSFIENDCWSSNSVCSLDAPNILCLESISASRKI